MKTRCYSRKKVKKPHRDTEGNSEIVHGINSPISRAEIIDAIQTTSSNTAPRADNIPNELLKKGRVAIVSILHKLLNIICLREAPSTIWERDLIRPLYKTKDPLLTENYRDKRICTQRANYISLSYMHESHRTWNPPVDFPPGKSLGGT